MTDQQRLRDALQAAVPAPPPTRLWSGESRDLAHRLRRRRAAKALAAVVVVAAVVPLVRSMTRSDAAPQPLHVVTHGTGGAACHQLSSHGLGTSIDARVVPHALAIAWDHRLARLPGRSATVCAFLGRRRSTVLATASGATPVEVARGDYQTLADTMTRLGALEARQAPTVTSAPFTCPDIPDAGVILPGSATLPTGATAARICDSIVGGPSQVLTSSVDDLVRAANAQPLTYHRASECSGAGGTWGYTLVLDYPTGTRVVAGDSCGWFGVGPVQRGEATPSIGEQFLSALRRQEDAKPLTEPMSCSRATAAPEGPGDLTRIVAARFCPAGTTGRGLLLTTRQLALLTRSTNRYEEGVSNGPIEGGCPRPRAGWPHLMLSDAWHQQFSVTLRCSGYHFWDFRFAPSGRGAVRPIHFAGLDALMRELVALTLRP